MIPSASSPTPRRTALGFGLAAIASSGAEAQASAADAPEPRRAEAGHVMLLGDSVFDNAAYVAGGPDVVRQVRARLPGGWRATLAARDGATTADVPAQLARVPPDASRLVVSAGGNDALREQDILAEPVRSVAEALDRLAAIRARFERAYHAMLEAVLVRGVPAAVCTIYDPRFPDPVRQRVAVAALGVFNDVITRAAFARGLPLLDLRLICSRDEDFANPIEPSVRGGDKIAAAIAELALAHDARRRRSDVFAG